MVLGDLAEMGYDARWGVLGAEHVGAPHKRHRLWIVAYPGSRWGQDNELCTGRDELGLRGAELANADVPRPHGSVRTKTVKESAQGTVCDHGHGWHAEPDASRVATGVARGLAGLRCLGNGQVPAVARLAWDTLTSEMGEG